MPASWKSFIDPSSGASFADVEPAPAATPRERQTQLMIAASLLGLLVVGLWLLARKPPEYVASAPPPAAVAQTTPSPPAEKAAQAPSESAAVTPSAPAPQSTATIVPSPAQAPSEPAASAPAPVKEIEPPTQVGAPKADASPSDIAEASAPAPPVATIAPSPGLRLTYNANNYIRYSGATKDEASRAIILDALKSAFGAQNVSGDIAIDANTASAPWLTNLKTALEDFKIPGLSAMFEGSTLRVGGLIADGERNKVIAALKELFGSDVSVETSTENPNAKALAAFNALKTGYGTRDAAEALNLVVVHFPSGSADLPAYNQAILKEAAAVLKQLPADAAIEIQGHTDRSGNAASNRRLSQKRAEAVRTALVEAGVPQVILTAKGYGSARPKASNDTPEGRFENRRIEFGAVR
jgi:OOP family OmpA-OmpF porin